MCRHAEKENGLHDLLEIMLESLMVAERGESLREEAGGQEHYISANSILFANILQKSETDKKGIEISSGLQQSVSGNNADATSRGEILISIANILL